MTKYNPQKFPNILCETLPLYGLSKCFRHENQGNAKVKGADTGNFIVSSGH